jgi:hypothetical protein
MFKPEYLMNEILDNACSNPDEDNPGFNKYTIETHCVGFDIIARKVNDQWEIKEWTTYSA